LVAERSDGEWTAAAGDPLAVADGDIPFWGKGSLAHGRVWGKNPGRSWAGFLCCVLNN
jgi:hypothetical protein